jgi:hypothetical protein
MEQKIVAFEQDEVGDWRAVLACGHKQHTRHNPPLVSRPWVLTEAGRQRFLGHLLNCKQCDEAETAADALVSGGKPKLG